MDPGISQIGGGPGRGIAQWSAGGRWDTGTPNVTDYASEQGKDVNDLGLQLDFIWYELNQVPSYGLDDLRGATTVEDAVQVFQDKYEICGQCAEGNRVKFAQDAFDAFGSDAPAASTDDPTAPGTDDPTAPGPDDPPDPTAPSTDPDPQGTKVKRTPWPKPPPKQ